MMPHPAVAAPTPEYLGAMAPDFRRKRSADRDDTSAPVLITAARASYQEELAARKKRYFLLMGIRIPALLLAAGALALWNNPWIAFAIVAGSIPIPWIAVIGANDRPPLPKGQARRYTAGALSNHTPYALPPGLTGNPSRGTTGGGAGGGPGGQDPSPGGPVHPGPGASPPDESGPAP